MHRCADAALSKIRGAQVDFMLYEWLTKPVWLWLSFLGIIFVLLAFDLGVLHRTTREIEVKESLWLSAFYIALGLLYAGFVYWSFEYARDAAAPAIAATMLTGVEAAELYITGFVIEKSLAMDNVFVIAMIFTYFAVPRIYQHRVLFWGILGVIVLRGLMIGLGAALVSQFSWVLYVFAVFLIFTGVKMWMEPRRSMTSAPARSSCGFGRASASPKSCAARSSGSGRPIRRPAGSRGS